MNPHDPNHYYDLDEPEGFDEADFTYVPLGYSVFREDALRALEVRLLHMTDRAKYYFEATQALPLLEELQDLVSAIRKSARE